MTVQSKARANIVIVDDTVENLQVLTRMLKQEGYVVRPVPNGRLALTAIENIVPDLILLDINMPEMDGFEVCRRIKAKKGMEEIPIIFISARDDTMDKVQAFGVGGVDYVTKPFHVEEVLARVATHLALRRANLAIQESHEKLVKLEELRDNLVHMVVHDMRTPISAVVMGMDVLKEELPDHLAKIDVVGLALEAGKRLDSMVTELLEVSRLEHRSVPLESKPYNLAQIANNTVARVLVPFPDREIRLELPDSLVTYCDKELIGRTIENLLNNGLKHTPEGRPLLLTIKQEAQEVRVSIRDAGSGVPVEYQEKIFEKFGTMHARSDQKYHSVGLGLAFCKLAVEAHGGRIGVDSQEGQGSTFWFTLPVT